MVKNRSKLNDIHPVVQFEKPHTYVKTATLSDSSDVENILQDLKSHTIVVVRITPLAEKSVNDVRKVIEKLYSFCQTNGGDIARLGEERVIVTPSGTKISSPVGSY